MLFAYPRFTEPLILTEDRSPLLLFALSTPSDSLACFAIILEAFISLSCFVSHFKHSQVLTERGSLSTTKLQLEQVLLEGKNLSISTICPPFHCCLYRTCLYNSPQPTSDILRDKCLFFIILATAKSSIAITAWFLP